MLSEINLRLADVRQERLSAGIDSSGESKLLDFYARITPRMLHAERCCIFINDPQNRKMWLKFETGIVERGIDVAANDSIVGEVIAAGKPVIASNLQSRGGAHKKFDAQAGFVTREIICVPVYRAHRSEVAGAIEVLNKKSGDGFNEEDQALLEEVSEHLQAVVDSILLNQEAVNTTRRLVVVASNAIVVAFLTVAVGIFLVVLLSVYGGLPFPFA